VVGAIFSMYPFGMFILSPIAGKYVSIIYKDHSVSLGRNSFLINFCARLTNIIDYICVCKIVSTGKDFVITCVINQCNLLIHTGTAKQVKQAA